LLGAWPLGPLDVDDLTGRLREYLTKALREAKQHTSWLDPDEAHEAAVIALAERSVAGGGRLFNETFGPLFDDVAFHGACNSLAQVVVKLALPGVADVYQGTELWDFSLVDPDNRRPVDYEARRAMLARDDAVLDEWRSGAVKLFVTSRSLHARRAQPELFVDGEFVPLAVVGAHAANVVAFARRRDDEWAVAVVPRCTTQVTRAPRFPLGDDVWADTAVVMPEAAPAQWRNVFGGPTVSTAERLPVARAFATLPVALMVPTARS
jgi:(1->4)-alpha-D-glucan 1-alpha-D-glucosylmutase